jgi:hypothetical protein
MILVLSRPSNRLSKFEDFCSSVLLVFNRVFRIGDIVNKTGLTANPIEESLEQSGVQYIANTVQFKYLLSPVP